MRHSEQEKPSFATAVAELSSHNRAPSADLYRAIAHAAAGQFHSPAEVAYLAMVLARSGRIIPIPTNKRADLASTGGMGSLATLLGPLIFATVGIEALKISVPGRPAGALDTLAQLKGYSFEFAIEDIPGLLDRSNFISIDAGGWACPQDGEFFKFRKEEGFLSIPTLIVASLLSKKIAAGVTNCGYELRYGPGTNISNKEDANHIKSLFLECSRLLGIHSELETIESNRLQQPFLGRSEALYGIWHLINGVRNEWLESHWEEVKILVSKTAKQCLGQLEPTSIAGALKAHLESQGTSISLFNKHIDSFIAQNRKVIYAPCSGTFCCDFSLLRSTLLTLQSQYTSEHQRFPDPCGIIFLSKPNSRVRINEPLASVRATNTIAEDLISHTLTVTNL